MARSTKVIVSLGSNHDSSESMSKGMAIITSALSPALSTAVTETTPLGGYEGPFFNALVTGYTRLEVEQLMSFLKSTEQECGDSRQLREEGKITLDIDLLKYGKTKYHLDDWERDYIKQLIGQLRQIKKRKANDNPTP